MASGPNMMDPICLVENDNELLSVNQEALQILEKISQPLVVVAIVGLYRTGKSYLMNRLKGQNNGFPLGSTVQSKTKGIWMWCVPHPSKSDHTLVLLDTEGLGDVEKGDPKNDSWIFALTVLLCSSFVYNSMNTINHQALEQLHYVTELTELIRAKSSSRSGVLEDSTEFVSFFPDFIWTVRDFTLELMLNGHPITEDEYLENALKLIPGKNPKAQTSNLPRECIRHFFPTRKCFVFDRPTNDKELLADIENVSEDQLDPKFLEQTNNFCSYIFTNAKTKTLREGITVTGNRLRTLVVTYVDTINTGAVPCLENAVTTLAQLENSAAVQKAADHYSEQMAQQLRLPTDTLQELLEVHAACEREAIAIFMEHSFKDENQEFQKNLVEIIKDKKEGFLLQNEQASVKYCQAKLQELSKALMENISAGTFSVPGGHELYRKAKGMVESEYCQVPRKGVKANEVLQNFLLSQVAIEKSILQADKALSDGEKAVVEEQARRETAEREQELLKQKLQELEQQTEARQRSLQENIAQLTEKLARRREKQLREHNMMLEHKLKANEVLQNFLLSQVAIEKSILQADKALSDGEKAVVEEQARRETAEREQELLKQKLQELEQQTEARQRSLQENIAQLTKKLARRREKQLREHNMMLEHKLKVQEALLKEGFRKKSEEMNAEINRLKNMIDNAKDDDTPWLAVALDKFDKEISSLLCTPGKLLGHIANEVLQNFLLSQVAIEKSILQADKALSDGEKAVVEEQARRETAEREQELLKQKLQELEQQTEARQRSLQENIAQLTKKLARRREKQLREHNMMLEHKLKVQEALLKEGFRKKSEEMNAEINRLKNMIDNAKDDDTPWLAVALDKFDKEISSLLCTPGKLLGHIANEVLQNFLLSQVAIEKSILQADKALSDGEKAVVEEQARRETAEREQELLKQKLQELEQQTEARQRSLQENIAQLTKKLARRREKQLREHNMMLEHKLKVQEALLKEGFRKKSEEMNAEINRLKNMIDNAKDDDTPWLAVALDKFDKEISSLLCTPGKLLGHIVSGVSSLFKTK
ncbi:guanylate-binding protein 6-like isoform X4 [Pseudorca crassidens]|uniref:guanylate-binding protein 6-like isoform X4 n=1 Tax=Pseudorca crassidens TaxID=82174 RepID=UPI00352E3F10